MATSSQADFLATKGIEYIMVLGYLAVLIPFWFLLTRTRAREVVRQVAARARDLVAGWFRLPEDVFLHPGHAWAAPEAGGDVVRVGMDDFAGKLLGRPDSIQLPPRGALVRSGETGWRLAFADRLVPVLSPVEGTVVETNPAVSRSPDLPIQDPYDKGWLMKVRVRSSKAVQRNLLGGRAARLWMQDTVDRLRARMGGELGPALQDGGLPVPGFARQLAPEDWEELAAEFLLTD